MEVLWELYKINFWCDLVVMDCTLAPSKWTSGGDFDAINRLTQILACFDGGDDLEFMLLPPKIPESNVSLACDKTHNALPFIMALACIIIDWNIPLDPSLNNASRH